MNIMSKMQLFGIRIDSYYCRSYYLQRNIFGIKKVINNYLHIFGLQYFLKGK
jgi:hypothetical protein